MNSFRDISQLRKAIIGDIEKDTNTFLQEISDIANQDGKSEATKAWESGKSQLNPEMAVKDSSGIMSGSVVSSAISPIIDIGDAKINLWDTNKLENLSTPGGGEARMPIWEMMNWGSGPKWNTITDLSPSSDIISKFGGKTAQLRNSGLAAYSAKSKQNITGQNTTKAERSKPISDRTRSDYVWAGSSKKRYGDLGKGYYAPEVFARKAKFDIIKQMQYFIPTHFIERSTRSVINAIFSKHPISIKGAQ